jgi:hypothetical protein
MERFLDALESVECADNMALRFKTKRYFGYALYAWDWVNERENNSLVMVANYPGCSPDSQRQPYTVHGFDYDEDLLTIYLHAVKRSWEEVAHSFILDVGQPVTLPGPSAIHPRQTFDPAPLTFPFNYNFPSSLLSVNQGGVDFDITCRTCGISGNIIVKWHVVIISNSPSALTVTIQPQSVVATLVLDLSMSASSLTSPYQQEIPTPVTLPGDIQISNVGSLGAKLELTFGLRVSALSGSVMASFGITATLSDDAYFTFDLLNPGNSQQGNWAVSLQPVEPSIQAVVSGNIEIYVKEVLNVTVNVIGVWSHAYKNSNMKQ